MPADVALTPETPLEDLVATPLKADRRAKGDEQAESPDPSEKT